MWIAPIRRIDGKEKDVELLSTFCDLRLTLSDRGLMEYREDNSERFGDDLYLKLNECEIILRDRIAAKIANQ